MSVCKNLIDEDVNIQGYNITAINIIVILLYFDYRSLASNILMELTVYVLNYDFYILNADVN
jgi:hypothetical protein